MYILQSEITNMQFNYHNMNVYDHIFLMNLDYLIGDEVEILLCLWKIYEEINSIGILNSVIVL